MRGAQSHIGACFPTGQHYPGIADRIAAAIQSVQGLADEFAPGKGWREVPLVIIDFETTGTDPSVDRVIEMGMVGFLGAEIEFCEGLLIDPKMAIPAESTAVHGITDEEVSGAPTFFEALPRILELLEARLPVAYNANFDRRFLLAELDRVHEALPTDRPLPPAMRQEVIWLDPLVWARELLKELKSRKLGEVAAHLNVPLEQAHRAAGDAEATGRVLLALAPQMPTMYGELIRLQTRYGAFQEAEFARFRSRR
ncbi:MAG: 3'-5' exonuclease [Myxococcales bacterium]|nr:3'-5' exonuclease [Myxococcales bacterium]